MNLRRATLALLAAYALFNLASLVFLATGIRRADVLTPFTTLTGMAFAILHAGQRLGWKRAFLLLALVFGVSLLFESVGVATGRVYGPYHYTDKLGPRFLGLVPYLIPAAWFMMSYPCLVIADRLVPARGGRLPRLLGVAAVGGLVMTAWDVIMDPMMVASGYWAWDVEGAYFGVPLQNFWGWWLTVFTTFALYLPLAGKEIRPAEAGLDRQALLGYLVTGLCVVAAALISGAGGLALAGFFAMTPWFLAGWLQTCGPAGLAEAERPPKRVGFQFKVRPDRLGEYRRHHEHVWPEMLDALRQAGWHHYTLFLRADGLVFGYFETTESLAAAQASMAVQEVNTRWQEFMSPFVDANARPDETFVELEEYFHLD